MGPLARFLKVLCLILVKQTAFSHQLCPSSACDTDFSALNHSITTIVCPANCWRQRSTLCGVGIYAKGSICQAAMQEQLIDASGGDVVVYKTDPPSRSDSTDLEPTCAAGGPFYSFSMTCATDGDMQRLITTVTCPSGCQGQLHPCGGGAYKVTSSVCAAAVNAGAISVSGGPVTVYKYVNGSNILVTNSGGGVCRQHVWFTFKDVDACACGNPCANGATCVDLLADFACVCPPNYGGKRCEKDLRCPRSKLHFPRGNQITDFAWFQGAVPGFAQATMCMWVNASKHCEGAMVSYFAANLDNEILMYYCHRSICLYVRAVVTCFKVTVTPKRNIHLCVWFDTARNKTGIYRRGKQVLEKELGAGPIRPGGSFILGQDQDKLNAGGLEAKQAFQGTISNFAMWPRVLTSSEIGVMHRTCICPYDYVIAMRPEKVKLYGNVTNDVSDACPVE